MVDKNKAVMTLERALPSMPDNCTIAPHKKAASTKVQTTVLMILPQYGD